MSTFICIYASAHLQIVNPWLLKDFFPHCLLKLLHHLVYRFLFCIVSGLLGVQSNLIVKTYFSLQDMAYHLSITFLGKKEPASVKRASMGVGREIDILTIFFFPEKDQIG